MDISRKGMNHAHELLPILQIILVPSIWYPTLSHSPNVPPGKKPPTSTGIGGVGSPTEFSEAHNLRAGSSSVKSLNSLPSSSKRGDGAAVSLLLSRRAENPGPVYHT